MSFSDLKNLFSLETLDTRFVVPANAPPKEALEEAAVDPAGALPVRHDRSKGKTPTEFAQPSLWNTPEFYFYYLVFAICVPLMFKAVVDVSRGTMIPEYLRGILLTNNRVTSKLFQVLAFAF
jgi:hypothetical protein